MYLETVGEWVGMTGDYLETVGEWVGVTMG